MSLLSLVTLSQVTLSQAILSQVTLSQVTLSQVMMSQVTLSQAILSQVILYSVFCYIMCQILWSAAFVQGTLKIFFAVSRHVRNKNFVASSIKDVFDNVEAQKNIDFIKETRFYKQL